MYYICFECGQVTCFNLCEYAFKNKLNAKTNVKAGKPIVWRARKKFFRYLEIFGTFSYDNEGVDLKPNGFTT